MRDIPDRALKVWFLLWEHADKAGHAFISQSSMAETLHQNERQIRRAIKDLVDEGFLTVERTNRMSGGERERGWQNLYVLQLDVLYDRQRRLAKAKYRELCENKDRTELSCQTQNKDRTVHV
jgi:DNA-binding transcriptional regulator YhcF (GntR family)